MCLTMSGATNVLDAVPGALHMCAMQLRLIDRSVL
jgi:hypothetical protein